MIHLHVVLRWLKLLSDDAAEDLQSPLTVGRR